MEAIFRAIRLLITKSEPEKQDAIDDFMATLGVIVLRIINETSGVASFVSRYPRRSGNPGIFGGLMDPCFRRGDNRRLIENVSFVFQTSIVSYTNGLK